MKNLTDFELNTISGGINICTPVVTDIANDVATCMNEASECVALATKYTDKKSLISIANGMESIGKCVSEENSCIANAIVKKLK